MSSNEIIEILKNFFSVFGPIFIMFFTFHFTRLFLHHIINVSFEEDEEIELFEKQEKYNNLVDYEEDSPIKNYY